MKRIVFLLLVVLFITGCTSPDPTAGPPAVFDPGVDPEAWVLVPGGEFLMGQFNHETLVDEFEIMVTDVTNVQYAEYLNASIASGELTIVENDSKVVGYYKGDVFREYRHEKEIAEGDDWLYFPIGEDGSRLVFEDGIFTVMPDYENHPVVMVTWFGAQGYCEYNQWRLPTGIEWEKAARGTDGRPFTWGDEITDSNANYYASNDPFEALLGKQGDTTPVGFYNGMTYGGFETVDSPSPYGLYDMAGNVEQWTGDVHKNQHYRYLRGGSKNLYAYDLRVWFTNNAEPDYFSPSIGFRCALSP